MFLAGLRVVQNVLNAKPENFESSVLVEELLLFYTTHSTSVSAKHEHPIGSTIREESTQSLNYSQAFIKVVCRLTENEISRNRQMPMSRLANPEIQ